MLSDVIKDIEQKMISNYSKGLSDGESRGEAKVLVRLLEKRFGPLTTDQRALIMDSESATLEKWCDRVIDAPTLDAVFAEPTIN